MCAPPFGTGLKDRQHAFNILPGAVQARPKPGRSRPARPFGQGRTPSLRSPVGGEEERREYPASCPCPCLAGLGESRGSALRGQSCRSSRDSVGSAHGPARRSLAVRCCAGRSCRHGPRPGHDCGAGVGRLGHRVRNAGSLSAVRRSQRRGVSVISACSAFARAASRIAFMRSRSGYPTDPRTALRDILHASDRRVLQRERSCSTQEYLAVG